MGAHPSTAAGTLSAAMLRVSNADRVVFPEIGKTKGDVVAYYQRVADRVLVHAVGRPLSIRRYPRGLAGPGFFQKNVPDHYPESIARFAAPRSRAASRKHPPDRAEPFTHYPVIAAPEHLPYLANQGAIELHVPTARAPAIDRPDRLVIDLDPPPGALALVRRAALLVRAALAELGVETVPVATGSKGYHLVAALQPTVDAGDLGRALHELATLLVARHPDELTLVFRVAARGGKVFVDWLRNTPLATVIVPYSLRARPGATVATPLSWEELEGAPPDAFTIDDVDRLLDRPDPLAALAAAPLDPAALVRAVDERFASSGLVLGTFDRFRS
jgi:bifunctional non-homologous end joining protein LigD